MTGNEIRKLAWDQFKRHPSEAEIELALAAVRLDRAIVVREIRHNAAGIQTGVAKPDLWALAQYIESAVK
jgi:hypothetical protein